LTADPEVIVPLWLQCMLALNYRCEYSLRSGADEKKEQLLNAAVMTVSDQLLVFTDAQNASFKTRCTQYIKDTFGDDSSAEMLAHMVSVHYVSLDCLLRYQTNMHPSSEIDELIPVLANKANSMLKLPTDHPLISTRANIIALHFQFKLLSWSCFRNGNLSISRALYKEWQKACESFIKLIKRGLRQEKEAVPYDPYTIALFSRMLLEAYLLGFAKTVTYDEIESLCNELGTAAESCSEYTPRMWQMEIEAERSIVVDDVLPFFRQAKPSSTSTAVFDVVSTPGYLQLYTPALVEARIKKLSKAFCYTCGEESSTLLKCAGVSFLSFFLFCMAV
jgi:hypothetical protein